ncbi:hypothetical protein RhoFasSB10_04098 [Rhodococcus fascians]|nr:hypothetical protein [Rhodococcus fascians]
MRKEHKTRKEIRAERRSSQDPAGEAANWRHGLRSVVRIHCATRRQWIDETDSRRKESTTVDIGNCQHADSNQRQLVADAVLGGRRHGQESSRGSGPTLIRGVVHVHDGRVSASDQPRDDDQRQQRDQSPCHPRPRHYSPSFVVDVEAESSASRAALASRPNTRRINCQHAIEHPSRDERNRNEHCEDDHRLRNERKARHPQLDAVPPPRERFHPRSLNQGST